MKILLSSFILFSSITHAAGIKITGASWGNKDATKAAAAFCDDKTVCSYKVSSRFITAPTTGNKAFRISWICDEDTSNPQSRTIADKAEGTILDLNCVKEVVKKINTNDRKDINPETVTYYENLLRKYKASTDSVQIEDFKKTFFPIEDVPQNERLLACTENSGRGDCEPDTLYSWGPLEKMISVKNASTQKNWGTNSLNGYRHIFMNQSSVGTYCYGLHPIRIKFIKSPERGGLNKGTFQNTFNEWIVKDVSRIESISYAQPEHIDEAVIEIMRRLDKKSNFSKAALYVNSLGFGSVGKEKIIKGCVPEIFDLSERSMVKSMMTLIEAYLNGKSWIHTKTCDTNCDSQEHFSTKWPTFFNPI